MKFLPLLTLAAMLTACGPNSGSDATDSQTTKTTTTVTTTTTPPPALPAEAPAAPAPVPVPSTLTQANLDRVQTDMSQSEVESIFGAPTSSQTAPIPIVGGTQTTYSYQSGTSSVTIVFKNNQVKEKSGSFGP